MTHETEREAARQPGPGRRIEVHLRRRTPAGHLRYLAAQLRAGERYRLPVSAALEVLAADLDED